MVSFPISNKVLHMYPIWVCKSCTVLEKCVLILSKFDLNKLYSSKFKNAYTSKRETSRETNWRLTTPQCRGARTRKKYFSIFSILPVIHLSIFRHHSMLALCKHSSFDWGDESARWSFDPTKKDGRKYYDIVYEYRNVLYTYTCFDSRFYYGNVLSWWISDQPPAL